MEQFRELMHAILKSSVPTWLDLKLTVPQLRTVFVIAHSQPASVAQVAQHLGIGEPTASHLISKLVAAGLVERAEDPADRRRMAVRLSPAGEARIEALWGWEDLLGNWLDSLAPGDLTHLRQGLRSVVAAAHTQAAPAHTQAAAPSQPTPKARRHSHVQPDL